MEAKKVVAYISVIMLVIVLAGILAVKADDTATVSILPDTHIKKGETVTVKGTHFPINSSARIDLLLPDATTVEGIALGAVNINGTFITTFTCPDKNGDGFVKVVDGGVVISVLVNFEGTVVPNQQLQVSMYPNMLLSNQSSHISVMGNWLASQNYVADVLIVNPLGDDYTSYYVLHKGKLELDYTFTMAGYYWLNISIETTPYYYSEYIEVRQNPNGGGGGGEGTNVTFEVTSTGNVFDIMLWKESSGYITSGNVSVKSPDGKVTSVPITNSVAEITASSMGTYTVKYITNGKQFSTTFSYRVTISFTSTNFDSNGKTNLRVLVDGSAPTGSIDVNVTGAVDTVISLDNGEAIYTATIVGDYTFQIYYMSVSKTTKETYDDTYSISTLDAQITGNQIYITGLVLGEKTQSAGSSLQVQISVQSQGNYKALVTTSMDGSFEAYVDIVDKGGIPSGLDVRVKASMYQVFGSAGSKTTTVHVGHDILGEYGWVIALLSFLIILLLWYKGYIYKWSGQKFGAPPKKILSGGGAGRAKSDVELGW